MQVLKLSNQFCLYKEETTNTWCDIKNVKQQNTESNKMWVLDQMFRNEFPESPYLHTVSYFCKMMLEMM